MLETGGERTPGGARGATSRRADVAGAGSAGESEESSSSSDDEEDGIEQLLVYLGQHQHELLHLRVCADAAKRSGKKLSRKKRSRKKKLKSKIKKLKRRVTHVLSPVFLPLFSRRAALYINVPDRVKLHARLVQPSPTSGTIVDAALDEEQVIQAVCAMYDTRRNPRVFGSVVGFPGRGKTYLLRLLLRSFIGSAPANIDAKAWAWWRSMPLFVISFNGVTAASTQDLELAAFDEKMPAVVRLLHSEMQGVGMPLNFSAFRSNVMTLLEARKTDVAELLWLASYVQQVRCGDPHEEQDAEEQDAEEQDAEEQDAEEQDAEEQDAEEQDAEELEPEKLKAASVIGLLLVDELIHLSQAEPPTEGRISQLKDVARVGKRCEPSACRFSSENDNSSVRKRRKLSARGSTEHVNSSVPLSSSLAASGPPPDRPPSLPSSLRHSADRARTALCAFAKEHFLRVCVTSLSNAFIRRERTASGSVNVPICELRLVEDDRVVRAVQRALASRRKGLQLARVDPSSLLPPEVVGKCLAELAGGHPRAAEILISAVETSRDGAPFLSGVLNLLQPGDLSLADDSIDILCAHPVVLAVGLLGYDVKPDTMLTGNLDWDYVYAQGALTRGVLPPKVRRTTRSTSSSAVSSLPIYGTRLNVAFVVSALARTELSAKGSADVANAAMSGAPTDVAAENDADVDEGAEGGDAVVERLLDVVGDEKLYAALRGVRAALELGSIGDAWEKFAFSALSAVSLARHICSKHLVPSLVRDGEQLPQLRKMTLVDLFPASPPYLGRAEWLGSAQVDATHAYVGIRPFKSFKELHAKGEKELLGCVWQPSTSNLPAVDGVLFLKCTSSAKGGPHVGQLIAVLLQFKHRKKIYMPADVIKSAEIALPAFRDASGNARSWRKRTAFVVLSRRALPQHPRMSLSVTGPRAVIVVDEQGLKTTFGPGLYSLVRSSAVAFGTQVVDVTNDRFPPAARPSSSLHSTRPPRPSRRAPSR